MICLCVVVYQLYESNQFDKIYEVLSTLKKKISINNILMEKLKDKLENPDFEQN